MPDLVYQYSCTVRTIDRILAIDRSTVQYCSTRILYSCTAQILLYYCTSCTDPTVRAVQYDLKSGMTACKKSRWGGRGEHVGIPLARVGRSRSRAQWAKIFQSQNFPKPKVSPAVPRVASSSSHCRDNGDGSRPTQVIHGELCTRQGFSSVLPGLFR